MNITRTIGARSTEHSKIFVIWSSVNQYNKRGALYDWYYNYYRADPLLVFMVDPNVTLLSNTHYEYRTKYKPGPRWPGLFLLLRFWSFITARINPRQGSIYTILWKLRARVVMFLAAFYMLVDTLYHNARKARQTGAEGLIRLYMNV